MRRRTKVRSSISRKEVILSEESIVRSPLERSNISNELDVVDGGKDAVTTLGPGKPLRNSRTSQFVFRFVKISWIVGVATCEFNLQYLSTFPSLSQFKLTNFSGFETPRPEHQPAGGQLLYGFEGTSHLRAAANSKPVESSPTSGPAKGESPSGYLSSTVNAAPPTVAKLN